MTRLHIHLQRENLAYKPGEEVRATAEWHLDAPQKRVEARLYWYTAGKVVPESRVVEAVRFEQPALDQKQTISFRLPDAPHSFQGTFTLLGWGIELVTIPANESARAFFHLSPSGSPLNLFWPEHEKDAEPKEL